MPDPEVPSQRDQRKSTKLFREAEASPCYAAGYDVVAEAAKLACESWRKPHVAERTRRAMREHEAMSHLDLWRANGRGTDLKVGSLLVVN
jgi:hypothetical protein